MLCSGNACGLPLSGPRTRTEDDGVEGIPEYLAFSRVWKHNEKLRFSKNMVVAENFVSAEEEASLAREIRSELARVPYELADKDFAVCGSKQAKKDGSGWQNRTVIDRAIAHGFPRTRMTYPTTHVIELYHSAYIRPHVICPRCQGDITVGLNLLSSSVMRLVNIYDPGRVVDVFLPARSLYTMMETARYDHTHAIIKEKHSFFKGLPVKRVGRISVVLSSYFT